MDERMRGMPLPTSCVRQALAAPPCGLASLERSPPFLSDAAPPSVPPPPFRPWRQPVNRGWTMSWKQRLEKVAEGHYVLPKTKTMRVDAHLFLSDKLLWGEGPEYPGL